MTDNETVEDLFPTMDPEDKARWIDALRSGKFRQGEGNLRRKQSNNGVRHCCLGVYAEVCGVEFTPILPPITTGTVIYSFQFPEYREDYTTLPEGWARPRGISDEVQNHLMKMNDEDGCSFTEIADWVDANL